ncbi:DUF418 domain-containing protein [Allosalinactinospora lopnorensis]|uniref:DUF418 domain-containing protein n=1 Tax=Allosalinactinospora lopnorensis TaxID=1352348 RepID=UPI000623DCA3|nr:DUF418 domain-containing protein [Allosalinactinospora lopnorensis]
MDTARPSLRAPVGGSERALAPDLARGFMLLLIVLANTPFYLWGRERGLTTFHPVDGSVPDQIVQAVIITCVDLRVYPMFAFLFGYGMVQLLLRQEEAGAPRQAALALLRRRNLWLLVFGFVHALLLWMGDILGAYGFAGLVLGALFLRRSNRVLLVWAGIGTSVLAIVSVLGVVGASIAAAADAPAQTAGGTDFMAMMTANVSETDPLAAAGQRAMLWPLIAVFQGVLTITVPVAILLGFWAARNRILEEPHRHLPLLRRVAIGGIAFAWLGGLPHALHHVDILPLTESVSWVFSTTQSFTGLLGGLGYAALFGLIGYRLQGRVRHGLAVTSVAAVGKRSLSCYLAQSVICAPLLSAWGLGLGAVMGSAQMAAFAVATWLVTVAGAYALERADRRGPAEVLLRRLSYPGSATAREGSATGDTTR